MRTSRKMPYIGPRSRRLDEICGLKFLDRNRNGLGHVSVNRMLKEIATNANVPSQYRALAFSKMARSNPGIILGMPPSTPRYNGPDTAAVYDILYDSDQMAKLFASLTNEHESFWTSLGYDQMASAKNNIKFYFAVDRCA